MRLEISAELRRMTVLLLIGGALEVLLEEVVGFKTGWLNIGAHEWPPENVNVYL